ncbi:beta-ketoacyl-ACP synthase III [Mucilaginibacter sp. UR6-11]|uniref:beta-ketoacyl-ACP synthase III n=1 Tax=Mucilaginibacter sp. UR6-11 TaxID=1435644 RepID=UPI001E4EF7DC|nr:ketoacyl-ACP synthase III [Mucilaginibacter sp. UR6-11]
MNKRRITAEITAIGGYVPEDRLTNKMLETMVETSDEWITDRTGIKERRILSDPTMATSDMAVLAIANLLKDSGLQAEEIDCLILATSTPDQLLAPAASLVCEKAGLSSAWGFDLNAACSGFLYALSMGASLIESQRYKKVIVVGADQMSAIVNYQDRNTCILFGDGAGAVLLEPSSTENGIKDYLFKTDGKGAAYLSVPAGGALQPASPETLMEGKHFVHQDGKTVFKAAIKGMGNACQEVMTRNGLMSDDIDWVVPHQANLRIINAVGKRLNFPPEKVKVNIQRYGNTTAATIPLCLWDYQADFKPGDDILLTAFGAGFTWGATYLKWGNLRHNNGQPKG